MHSANSLQEERKALETAVHAAQQQQEETCRDLQAVQAAVHAYQLELADARAALQRLAFEVQASSAEVDVRRRTQESQGRLLRALACQVEELVGGYEQELANMRDKMESEEERGQCCICMEARASVALVPCGHVCVCAGCVGAVHVTGGQCPMCRAETSGVLPVFAA